MLNDIPDAFSLDDETCWISTARTEGGLVPYGAATARMIERLRRLEDQARCAGASRQTFQRLASARRLLGDGVHVKPFAGPFGP